MSSEAADASMPTDDDSSSPPEGVAGRSSTRREDAVLDAGSYFGEDWDENDAPTDDATAPARMTRYVAGVLPGIHELLYLINVDVPPPEAAHDPSPWAHKDYRNMEQRAWENRQARRSFADAVLHCAKRAISIAHGGIRTCPPGRLVTRTQDLATVIWQARNQSHHWEEGDFRRPTRDCFELLAVEVDPVFGEYRTRSMSIEVLNLLGWRSSEAFDADLTSLGGA